jgi:hypothetical protein
VLCNDGVTPHTAASGPVSHASAARARSRRARRRGAVMVEYAFLLVAFGVPVMGAVAAAGLVLYKNYGDTRNLMLQLGP